MLRHEKLETFFRVPKKQRAKTEQILYMGDDIPDIPPMKHSGLATCPQDAVPEVKASCSLHISPRWRTRGLYAM